MASVKTPKKIVLTLSDEGESVQVKTQFVPKMDVGAVIASAASPSPSMRAWVMIMDTLKNASVPVQKGS